MRTKEQERERSAQRRLNTDFVLRERKRQEGYGKVGDRDPVALLTYDAKRRAKNRQRPYAITKDDVRAVWPADGRCPYCEVEMCRHTMRAPSLDEVIVGRGYVVGNIEVVCRQCNSHKNSYPVEWFERIAARMRQTLEAGILPASASRG